MTLVIRSAIVLTAFLTLTVATAAPARADWLFTPYLGVSFVGDTEGQNITYGGSIGYMGAGVMGFVRENFGLRGDVRYFRSVQDSDVGDDIDVDFGSFDFWRGTVGATFRF